MKHFSDREMMPQGKSRSLHAKKDDTPSHPYAKPGITNEKIKIPGK